MLLTFFVNFLFYYSRVNALYSYRILIVLILQYISSNYAKKIRLHFCSFLLVKYY